MGILRTPNGYLLVGGRLLTVDVGTVLGETLSLSLTSFPVGNTIAKPVFQRKAGSEVQPDGGYADVPVLYSYTGDAPLVQGRIVNADTSQEIVGWTDLANPQANDATHTGLATFLNVPIGAEYNLHIRVKNKPELVFNGSQRWGVGVNIVMTGQSNMMGLMYSDSYNSPVPGTNPVMGEHDYWRHPDFPGTYFGIDGFVATAGWYNAPNTGSTVTAPDLTSINANVFALMRIVGGALKAKYGRKIPVCVTPWAFNGVSLEFLRPQNTANTQVFTNSGTTITQGTGSSTVWGRVGFGSPKGWSPGDYEIILLHQGENESTNDNTSVAARVNKLEEFYASHLAVVAPAGRTAANLAFIPAVLGCYDQFPFVEKIRAAHYEFVNTRAPAKGWPRVMQGFNCIDQDTGVWNVDGDGMHFSDKPGKPYKKWAAFRAIQSTLHALGLATYSGMGPRITSVSRTGLEATVTVTHEGGTQLNPRTAGQPLTGWYAHTRSDFDDALGQSIAVTAEITGASTIKVTFPSGTNFAAGVYLKHLGGKPGTAQSKRPDLTNIVCDNAQYPSGAIGTDLYTNGLPLQPTPTAIPVT